MDELDRAPNRVKSNPGLKRTGTGVDSNNNTSSIPNHGIGSDDGKPHGTTEDFWKVSNKDIDKFGYMGKNVKGNQVVPFSNSMANTQSLRDNFSRAGTASDKNRYNKEKERDPAVLMAALHYKKLHELRNEQGDTRFSYFCSTEEKINDLSNSHPSFRIYFSFLKRFAITMAIVCLLGNCLIAYNGSSSWYSAKDVKFGFEWFSLGNIDGIVYQSEGSYSTSIGKENADQGRNVTIGIDLTITVFLIMFFIYQIFISRLEMRAKGAPISIKDYAVKVTRIQKG